MRLIIGASAAMVIVAALSGCGGSLSSFENSIAGSTKSYSGNYVGTFTTSQNQTGSFAVDITSNGTATATQIVTTSPASVTAFAGTISSSGAVTLTGSNATETGTLSLNSGELTGTLTNNQGTTISVTLVSSSGGSTYAGAYSGTFTNNLNQSGTVTLVIGTSGSINGLELITLGSTLPVSGTITSAGTTTLTVSGTAAVSGPLALNSSDQLTGTLTNSTGQSLTLVLPKSQ